MSLHKMCFRVSYEDTDIGGVVYHARYFGLAERARNEALREVGLDIGHLFYKEGISFAVRQAKAFYHTPIRLDELMEVQTRLISIHGARVLFEQKIVNLSSVDPKSVELPAANLEIELVHLRLEVVKPVRISPQHRILLGKLAEPARV